MHIKCTFKSLVLSLLVVQAIACGGPQPTAVTPDPEPPRPQQIVDEARPAPPPVALGKPRTDLIPRSLMFGNPERVGVQLSPDGKHMSWLAPKDGVMNVWVAPTGKLDQARAITGETSRPIRRYFWAYTNQHVLYLQDREGDENFHVFRAGLDGKTADLTPFKDTRAEVADLNHRFPGKVLVLLNDRDPKLFDVHELDLLAGTRKLVAANTGNFTGFTIDNAMQVRFAERKLPDGATEVLERTQPGPKADWKKFDTIPFADAESTTTIGFLPGNRSIYVTDTRGRDTGALVVIDLATRKKRVVAEDPKADAGAVITHPTTRAVQAVEFEHARSRWQVLDQAIASDLAALAKLDGGDVEVSSRTLDDKTWLVTTSSDVHPRRFYVWDRAKQHATFLFAAQPDLERQPLVKMWPVEIRARDGLTLVSYLTLPASADPDADGKPNTAVPLVLFVHGGPWSRDTWGYRPAVQVLANRGYAVLNVNFRGSTGFGKKFLNAANLQWGKAMHDDLLDGVDWAVKAGITSKDTVCIMGGSYGGYATLVGLAMTPEVFRCGVDIVGISNLHTFIASFPPYWAPALAQVQTRVGDFETAEGKALLTEVSPLTHAAKIKRPLLIGQGANDPRVKQAESEQIVAAMKQHRLPVTYVLFPDEGHGFARPENNIAFFAITEAFLSVHLGGYYLPIAPQELAASSMQIKEGQEGIPGLP